MKNIFRSLRWVLCALLGLYAVTLAITVLDKDSETRFEAILALSILIVLGVFYIWFRRSNLFFDPGPRTHATVILGGIVEAVLLFLNYVLFVIMAMGSAFESELLAFGYLVVSSAIILVPWVVSLIRVFKLEKAFKRKDGFAGREVKTK